MKTNLTQQLKRAKTLSKNLWMIAAGLLLQQTYAHAQDLIVYEPFNYTLNSTANDPDGGLNNNNGLPATNIGGAPVGTGTGLRTAYGAESSIVAGLNYPGLAVAANAANITNANWGTNVYIYRDMTTDPFLTSRVGGDVRGDFTVDGQSLYFSFIAQTSSATDYSFRFALNGPVNRNIFITNAAGFWTLNEESGTNVTSTATFAINTPTLLVVKIDFKPGIGEVVSLYKNPTIGGALPVTPDATLTISKDWLFSNINTRPSVANAMTIDEFRMGKTYASVTPAAVVVPVGLSNAFTAQVDGNRAKLAWSTASEVRNSHFTVERSVDGINYTVVRTEDSKGNAASYAVYDNSPASGTNYYRLSQTDNDGETKVLGTASLKFALSAASSLSVYPNPTTDKIVVNLDNYSKAVTITLLDQTGKQVYAETVSGGLSNYQLKLSNKLASGVYILNLNGEGLNEVKKVIVK